jgi:hypothetical protein
MPFHTFAALAALTLAFASTVAAAPPAPAPSAKADVLDHKALHDQYNEGNFDAVISVIEGFLKRNKTHSLADSVFIAKHLAVVYTANPATREKGKYYMHRLLELVPSAKLVDMYVSEEIDRIFDKIREEFNSRQQVASSAAPATPAPEAARPKAPAAEPAAAAPRKNRSTTGFWIAGGTAVVAAGLTAAYIIHQSEEEPDRNFHVPRQ